MSPKIKVGVSACLLGQSVRWDGNHQHNRYITGTLGRYFEWLPVCPEVELGMGVPREAVRLEGNAKNPQMIGIKTAKDWTVPMNAFASKRSIQITGESLCGYIFKSRSPSCGIARVKVLDSNDSKRPPKSAGTGLFAAAFMKRFPLIPVEEDGRLNDSKIFENFIVRVFAYARLQQLLKQPFRRAAFVDFHTRHKYLLLAHSTAYYQKLGRIVASIKTQRPAQIKTAYASFFMTALKYSSTVKKNSNVLQHMMGFLKQDIGPFEKRDILKLIGEYQKKTVPLMVPLSLIRHYIEKYQVTYLLNQNYLSPYPNELMPPEGTFSRGK